MALDYRDEFIGVNGIRLHYLDWGGDGPPLLLLHPTGFHAHVWDRYVAHFAPRFHCYAVDFRGHGDSDKPGIYGWGAMSSDIARFVEALDLHDLTGVGHSAGGTAVAVLAAQLPERVRRAVLIDPILVFRQESPLGVDSNLAAGAAKRRMVWPSRAAMLERYGSRPPFNGWDPDYLALYVNYGVDDQTDGTVILKCPGEHEAEVFRQAGSDLDPVDLLQHIACPTLVIAGERSDAFPPARVQQVMPLLRHAELLRVPHVGHFVPFQRPAEVMAAIDRFIAETDASSPK